MADVECFFDCSSPWTYFAFHNLLLMQKELGIEVAHGTLAGVTRPGTLDLMAERVIPAVASF